MSDAARALTEQFLLWVLEKPRSYREVMDAWRTTCPQLTIWEMPWVPDCLWSNPGKACRMRRS